MPEATRASEISENTPGQLFPFRVKDSHDTEDIMAGLSFDLEIKKTAYILEKGRVDRSADGRGVDLHLDTMNILKIRRVDKPFRTFTVTF